MVRKILIYGDLDLNIIDGSSIWLVNLVKLLVRDQKNHVDILLKKKVKNHILIKDVERRYRVKCLYIKDYIDHITEVDAKNAAKVFETLDCLRDYSCIIVRGVQVMESLVNSSLVSKIIPYLTDFCHNKELMSTGEKQLLKKLYEKTQAYFVQTDAMKEYLKEVLDVDGEKFHILYPVVFSAEKQEKRPNTIVYTGKIAKDWNINELLEIMKQLKDIKPSVHLHFVGNKVNQDLYEQKKEILENLQNEENITFHGALPHDEAMRIAGGCCLGYAYRSSKVDHDQALELSVKLLEYCFNELPVLLRKTKMHVELLGEDYPLYVDSKEECMRKILLAFQMPEVMQKARKCLCSVAERFSANAIYAQIRRAFEPFQMKKMRLLISGHDLKFIKALFPYFRTEYQLEVQELQDYMEFSGKKSRIKLGNADIIWCEWLLTAAQWYSQNAYPHQSLFIRAHRFEIMRNYGYHINLNRITKIVTVSYYWYEEFARKFRIPYEKCTIIDNYIDTEKYVCKKTEDSCYHLALIGALPKRKGLKKAVKLLKLLKEKDSRYCLHVPGKKPEEFPNSWNIPEERQYYEQVYQDIERNGLQDSITFDGWVEMSEFLCKVGFVLSLSDARMPESFHLTPLEGMASGAVTAALRWDGIEYIYPEDVVWDSLEEIAEYIDELRRCPDLYRQAAEKGKLYVQENYDIAMVWNQIRELLNRGDDYEEYCNQDC